MRCEQEILPITRTLNEAGIVDEEEAACEGEGVWKSSKTPYNEGQATEQCSQGVQHGG